MTASKLSIVGPYTPWSPEVREGRIIRGDSRTEGVLLRLLPGLNGDPATLDALYRHIGLLTHLPDAAMLRPLTATALSGTAAYVYPARNAASLAFVLSSHRERQGWLPMRVCISIAAAVASAMSGAIAAMEPYAGLRIAHAGPSSEDVLISTDGAVLLTGTWVLGVDQPLPIYAAQGYAPPEGMIDARSLVYGVGALTLEVLSGNPPPEGSQDTRRHDEAIRAALNRLNERPGEPVPPSLGRLLRLSLSGNPAIRPSIMGFASQLAQLAAAQRGPEVAAWAGAAISRILSARPELDAAKPGEAPPRRTALPVAPLPPPPAWGDGPPRALGHDRPIEINEIVDDDETVKEGTSIPVPLGAEPEPTQEADLSDALEEDSVPEPLPITVGPSLFRAMEMQQEDEPSEEATVRVDPTPAEPPPRPAARRPIEDAPSLPPRAAEVTPRPAPPRPPVTPPPRAPEPVVSPPPREPEPVVSPPPRTPEPVVSPPPREPVAAPPVRKPEPPVRAPVEPPPVRRPRVEPPAPEPVFVEPPVAVAPPPAPSVEHGERQPLVDHAPRFEPSVWAPREEPAPPEVVPPAPAPIVEATPPVARPPEAPPELTPEVPVAPEAAQLAVEPSPEEPRVESEEPAAVAEEAPPELAPTPEAPSEPEPVAVPEASDVPVSAIPPLGAVSGIRLELSGLGNPDTLPYSPPRALRETDDESEVPGASDEPLAPAFGEVRGLGASEVPQALQETGDAPVATDVSELPPTQALPEADDDSEVPGASDEPLAPLPRETDDGPDVPAAVAETSAQAGRGLDDEPVAPEAPATQALRATDDESEVPGASEEPPAEEVSAPSDEAVSETAPEAAALAEAPSAPAEVAEPALPPEPPPAPEAPRPAPPVFVPEIKLEPEIPPIRKSAADLLASLARAPIDEPVLRPVQEDPQVARDPASADAEPAIAPSAQEPAPVAEEPAAAPAEPPAPVDATPAEPPAPVDATPPVRPAPPRAEPAFGGLEGPLPPQLPPPPVVEAPRTPPPRAAEPSLDVSATPVQPKPRAAAPTGAAEPSFDLSATPVEDQAKATSLRPSRAPWFAALAAMLLGGVALGLYAMGGDPEPSAEPTPIDGTPANEATPPEPDAPPVEEAPTGSASPSEPSPTAPSPTPSATPPTSSPRPPSEPAPSAPQPEEPDIEPRLQAAPRPTSTDPSGTDPQPSTPPQPTPAPIVAKPAEEAPPVVKPEPATPAVEAAAPFTATFRIGDPSVMSLTVKCNTGTSSGNGPVVVSNALPGPCRVQGSTESGGVVAFFDLRGPGDFTCFEGGSRSCK